VSLVGVGEPLLETAYRNELVGKGLGVYGTKCDCVGRVAYFPRNLGSTLCNADLYRSGQRFHPVRACVGQIRSGSA